jgi:endonuclease
MIAHRIEPSQISPIILRPESGRRGVHCATPEVIERKRPNVREGSASAAYGARPEEDLLYQVDGSHFRRFDSVNDPAPIHSKSDVEKRATDHAEKDDAEEAREFAYESDLRDFLATNLQLIEPGLKLYSEEGVTGVEFPAGGRFIDILAVDARERLVVIELKVSRGYDRVVGQLLRYMGWIEQNLAEVDTDVRGIIAAREISDDLKLACTKLRNVDLVSWSLAKRISGSVKVCCRMRW